MKPFKQWILLRLSYFFIWLFHRTYRYELVQQENFHKALAMTPHRHYALASWHNNCLAGILAHSRRKVCLMVSRSFDGEMVAFMARKLGMGSVRGSSSKGGKEALGNLAHRVADGWSAAITVDGPRGPYKEVKAGIISLSKKTMIPIQPVCARGEKQWVLHRSWDQFRVPKPFTRVAVVYGEPFQVPEDVDPQGFEQARLKVYNTLESLESVASQYFEGARSPKFT